MLGDTHLKKDWSMSTSSEVSGNPLLSESSHFCLEKNLSVSMHIFKRPKCFQAGPPEHVNDVIVTLVHIV